MLLYILWVCSVLLLNWISLVKPILVLVHNFVIKGKGNSKLARDIILPFPNKVGKGAKVYFSSKFRLNKEIKKGFID